MPPELLAPSSSVPLDPATTDLPTPSVEADVWLVDTDGLLVSTTRQVASPVTAPKSIVALLEGVTPEEQQAGLGSAIPSTTTLKEFELLDGTLTLILSDDLADAAGEGQRRAIAQLVFTSLGSPDVDRVLFELESSGALEPPTGSGAAESGPLTRGDFPDLLAPAS